MVNGEFVKWDEDIYSWSKGEREFGENGEKEEVEEVNGFWY